MHDRNEKPDSALISSSPGSRIDERATAGQLALEMMHEIRNPLEALSHLTYLTLEEKDDPQKVEKYMLLANEQMRMLNRIASQTLGFARVSDSPRPIDLLDLAEAALRIHQRTIEAKKIHLVKDLPAEVVAEVKRGQMLQVVSNLLRNALDALPEAGTITIRLRKRAEQIHLIVADNGQGIRPEHLEKIFEPFFTTKDEAGNGLGLSLSKRIVEDHHGRITIRSSVRPERQGTVLRITLPVSKPED
ncbi:MAG: sensor histidine kinase [Janthinobacterium lividum]